MKKASVEVAIRVRPMRQDLDESRSVWEIHKNSMSEKENDMSSFTFDKIYKHDSTTDQIYEQSVRESVIANVVKGYNGTVFAYGQTGSGKSYTMLGQNAEDGAGIVSMAVHELFELLEKEKKKGFRVNVFVAMLEIYNEHLRDLLVSDESSAPPLSIRENEHGVYVHNAVRRPISNAKACLHAIHEEAESRRTSAATAMNPRSSRSHCLIRILVEKEMTYEASDDDSVSSDGEESSLKKKIVSSLNLVDLAGSERVSKTGATGIRMVEGGMINKSLTILTTVINKLTDKATSAKTHIPYRDSKLTHLLKTALGGNSFTTVFCCLTAAEQHVDESRSTLQFASRAKAIKNAVVLNEVAGNKTKIRELEIEIKRFKATFVAMQLYLWSKDHKIKMLKEQGGQGNPAEIEQMETLIQQLTAENLELRARAEAAEQMQTEVQHIDPNLGLAEDNEKLELRSENENLKQRMLELENDSEVLADNINELEDLCDELGKESDEKDETISEQKKKIKELEVDIQKYLHDISSMNTRVDQMEEQRKLEEQNLLQRSRGDSLLEQLTKMHVDFNALQVEHSTLLDMFTRAEIERAGEIAKLTDRATELEEVSQRDHEHMVNYKSWLWRLMSVAALATHGKALDSTEVGGTVREQQVEAAIKQLNGFVASRSNKPPSVTRLSTEIIEEAKPAPHGPAVLVAGGAAGGVDTAQLENKIRDLELKIQQKDAQRDILIDTKLKRMQELVMRLHTQNLSLKTEVSRVTTSHNELLETIRSDPKLSKIARREGFHVFDEAEILSKSSFAPTPQRPVGHN